MPLLNDDQLQTLADRVADVILARVNEFAPDPFTHAHHVVSGEAKAIGLLAREVPENATPFEMATGALMQLGDPALFADDVSGDPVHFRRKIMDAIRLDCRALKLEFLRR